MTASSDRLEPRTDAPPSLIEILDAVERLAQRETTVSVEDVIQTLGRASSSALIFIPGVIATSPLSGIPGLSSFCGITVTLLAAQAAIGRDRLWLPAFVTRRTVDAKRLYNALEKVRRPLAFLDRHTQRRLTFLTAGPGAKLLFALCMLIGMTMPFLEVIPFSASIAGATIALVAAALLTLDGALVVTAGTFLTAIVLGISLLVGL
jgi:hypothetical protein